MLNLDLKVTAVFLDIADSLLQLAVAYVTPRTDLREKPIPCGG